MNWIAGYKQHYKALIFLGLPIVIGQVGVIILGFADTLMIGHHSTEELGAASFVNNVFTLCIIFSTGFSYGLTPIVGSLYGNRRFAEAGQALRCSLVANVLVALLLTFIMTVVYFNVERLGAVLFRKGGLGHHPSGKRGGTDPCHWKRGYLYAGGRRQDA